MVHKNKMITCTCGNTDLEKISVRLQSTEDGKTLSLFALICRGDGCGRVTFRPQETSKSESAQASKPVNGNFTESAKVIEGARLLKSTRLVDGAKIEEGVRLIESPRVVEGARLMEIPQKTDVARENGRNGGSKSVAELFERVYTERLVYKAIAERDPNCPDLFEALRKNEQICSGISAAFGQVNKRLDANEDLLTALQSLPSLSAR